MDVNQNNASLFSTNYNIVTHNKSIHIMGSSYTLGIFHNQKVDVFREHEPNKHIGEIGMLGITWIK